ncbi:hypothetical protein WICMUC_001111 [Wickerhamomyces mucosus]|uniref:Cytochrome P450 n=1 Tax=Wickerhamomyces mucosus TaxID=1378264 RepID=A0A9P8PXA8_9ASCO|nr:hypothetical protein WICMUC_001111 [Wickerhamomyces mucosus]
MFSSSSLNIKFIFLTRIVYLLLDWIGLIGPKPIRGLPKIPSLPIVGNIFEVIKNPSVKYSEWAERYGDVFQMRIGNKIVVVANSFESVKELWIKNGDANNSRPLLYTFHSVVSSTQGFTIGTTPYGESYKKKKKIVATALNKKSIEQHKSFIAEECHNMFQRIDSQIVSIDDNDIDLFKVLQGFVLRVSLYLTYGYLVEIDNSDRDELFDEICLVENRIIRLRGHTSNLQDYLPFLRFMPTNTKTSQAMDYRNRRDVYMDGFKSNLQAKIQQGSDYKDSLVSRALDPDNKDFPKVNSDELRSICLTMVSAGLDNTPLVLNHILGHLSHKKGKALQDIALKEIEKVHGCLKKAFFECQNESKVDYVIAILREGLRYFTVLPTSLPRTTTKPIFYKGVVIPAGTIMFMNAFGANHDCQHYELPFDFDPNRYLNQENKLKDSEGLSTFTFGAGSRMCAGSHLAMKEMYVALIRFIILYQIESPQKLSEDLMELDPFKLNSVPDSVAFEPKPFKVKLKKRNDIIFDQLVYGK